jgi:predicted aminopeptidase
VQAQGIMPKRPLANWNFERKVDHCKLLIYDKGTSAMEKKKLNTALNIIELADKQLLFQSQGSYQDYVKLNRRHVVWNVFAAFKDSLEPKISYFVVASCLPYFEGIIQRCRPGFVAIYKSVTDVVTPK